MADYVSWVLEVEVLDGQEEAFRELVKEMVAATDADEPGTVIYEWSLDEAGKFCAIHERYVDSAAVMVHMTTFGKVFAKRFLSVCRPKRMTVFGSPDETVKKTLAALKPLYLTQIGGFERAVMWERYKGKQHQLYIYWWDDAPEPDRYMYSLFHSKSRDYYYKNTAVDELLDKGRTIMDRAERAKVYAQIDEMLYQDAPWAFLYVVPEVFGVANDVDYQGRRDGFLNMRYAKPKK